MATFIFKLYFCQKIIITNELSGNHYFCFMLQFISYYNKDILRDIIKLNKTCIIDIF